MPKPEPKRQPKAAPIAAPKPTILGLDRELVRERLSAYLQLIRFDRPIGWLLLLWPTYWGLWLAAKGMPRWGLLVIFTLGVWLTRSAGCIVNDFADRWLDDKVERTRQRPLATGLVAPREALTVFAVLMLVAFGLVLLTNALTVYLSVGALALAVAYPYMKRWTWWPQVWLGTAFGMSIPMAFTAVTGALSPLAWLAFVANVLWSTAYDTLSARVDRDDDIQAGAKSTAILFGELDLAAIGILHASFLLAMALVGFRAGLGRFYAIGWGLALVIGIVTLVIARTREREDCFQAFKLSHWMGFALWAGMVADYALP
jgi:4-hydroxybenzoate polyprenyltransferase